MKFCTKCGNQIPRCPTCGKVVETRAKFCTGDGTLLPENVLAMLPESPVAKAPARRPAREKRPEQFKLPVQKTQHEEAVVPPERQQPVSPRLRFCTKCGKPCVNGQNLCPDCLDRQRQEPTRRTFCTKCGRPCADGRNICVECQSKMRTEGRNQQEPEKKSNSGTIILVTVIAAVILLIIGVVLFFVFRDGGSEGKKDDPLTSDGIFAFADENKGEWDFSGKDDEEEETITIATEAPTETVTEPEETEPIVETTAPTTAPTEPTVDENSVEYRVEYFINNCHQEYFSQDYFDGFGEGECRLARNAIYAHSGRMFNDASLQEYYEQYDWYVPSVSPSGFSASMLNSCQTSNINAILNFEAAHGFN